MNRPSEKAAGSSPGEGARSGPAEDLVGPQTKVRRATAKTRTIDRQPRHASRPPAALHGVTARCSIEVLRPGRVPYARALELQGEWVVRRRAGEVPDTLVLLEHDPVITLGRGADRSHVLLDRELLKRRGIALFETGRGGDVTVHSPGQVVGYPILALGGARRDAHAYLRSLEEVMIRAAAEFGVTAARVSGLTGIWVGGDKLGAIGVRLNSGWITSHGFAFNVSNDLSLFDVIVPCGITGRGVTSLTRLLGRPIDPQEVMDRLAAHFIELFGVASTTGTPAHDPERVTDAGESWGHPRERTGEAKTDGAVIPGHEERAVL